MFKILSFLFFTFFSLNCFSQDLTATVKTVNSVIAGKDFIVEISINKTGTGGFMKYFQELPPGYSATTIETKGGDFTFADNGAKIIWMAMPFENQLAISYKINTPENASGTVPIGGKFSYIVDNERKIFEVTPVNVIIGKVSESALPKETPKEIVKEIPVEKKVSEEPKKEALTIIPPPSKAPATAASVVPGKTFRVQIGAFTTKPKLEGVPEPSTVVLDNGVTKYFSGNFKTYEDATKRKKELIEKGFQGAFVVSFENGRIVK